MNGQADGAIIVDTGVDASGLEKGMDALRRSMESLTAAIERIGKKMDSAVSAYAKSLAGSVKDVQKLQDGVAQTGDSTKSALSGMEDKTRGISAAADKAAESYGKVAQDVDKAKAALDALYQKRDEMKLGDAKLTDAGGISGLKVPQGVKDIGAYVQDAQNLLVEIQAAEKALADLEAKRDALKDSAIFSASETAQAGEYAGKVQQVGESFSETSNSAKAAVADIEESTQDITKSVGAEINGIITQLNTFGRDFEAVQNGSLYDNGYLLSSWLDGYEKAVNRLSLLRNRLATEDESLQGSEAEITKYTQLLYELEEQARASQEEIRNFAKQAGISLSASGKTAPVIAELESGIEKAETALAKFQAKVEKMDAIGATDKAWASVSYDIGLAADEAARLQTELDKLSESGDIDETQYESLSQRLQDISEQYANLAGQPDIDPEPVKTFGDRLADAAQSAAQAATALLKMAGSSILSGLRLIGKSAEEAAQSLTKMTATAVSSGIRRLGAWLSNAAKSMTIFGRSAKQNNGILKKSFATILKYGLGVRSFYFLFRKIRQAIGEGYQNLARYSDTLNKSISGVISSFKRFENQFAASFEPLVNTIAPALTNLINSLTEGTYRVGEFIAALSGQKTVTKAKEVQEDYAESLDKTKKAAKDAERQLAGFDQLNILKKPDEEETKPEDMFETVLVEDEAKDFADAVKEAWVNVDLSDIGGTIGGKLKIALDNIPWPDIKKAASDMGKRLATFLNGLINVPGLGKSLGKSIAEAINTAFAFLDGFVWEFEWDGLGNAIMDAVEAACDNLNWELINHALQGLAIGLADLLNTIFSRKEVWEKVGRTIGKAINAAVNAGITFLERFDFKQAAIAITAGLNAMIDEIEWR